VIPKDYAKDVFPIQKEKVLGIFGFVSNAMPGKSEKSESKKIWGRSLWKNPRGGRKGKASLNQEHT